MYLNAMMSEALKVNTVLTEINLNSNNIGDDGAAALAQVLEQMLMRMWLERVSASPMPPLQD